MQLLLDTWTKGLQKTHFKGNHRNCSILWHALNQVNSKSVILSLKYSSPLRSIQLPHKHLVFCNSCHMIYQSHALVTLFQMPTVIISVMLAIASIKLPMAPLPAVTKSLLQRNTTISDSKSWFSRCQTWRSIAYYQAITENCQVDLSYKWQKGLKLF